MTLVDNIRADKWRSEGRGSAAPPLGLRQPDQSTLLVFPYKTCTIVQLFSKNQVYASHANKFYCTFFRYFLLCTQKEINCWSL